MQVDHCCTTYRPRVTITLSVAKKHYDALFSYSYSKIAEHIFVVHNRLHIDAYVCNFFCRDTQYSYTLLSTVLFA